VSDGSGTQGWFKEAGTMPWEGKSPFSGEGYWESLQHGVENTNGCIEKHTEGKIDGYNKRVYIG